ncbi:unnamed protein product [Closterium sp. NIES-54]
MHSDYGGEFSSGLLEDLFCDEGITQTFTLPACPQENGNAERRIGLIMEVSRTSMIHAAAPHFMWPFAVQSDAHQLNLWPRISKPETSPTLRWMGEVGVSGQGTAQTMYDAVVTRYSSPATTTLGRLLLPYLFLELSAFTTVKDLVSHLRASDARYRAAAPAEFLDRNQPLMFITLYIIGTRLPHSLRSVGYHFLSLDPTSLTVDLLEQHLLAVETSIVALGAARGTPRTPFFEGAAAARARVAGEVAVAAGVVVGAAVEVVGAVEVVAAVGVVAAKEAVVGVVVVAAVGVVAVGLELRVEVLQEARGSTSIVRARPRRPRSFTCKKAHTQHRCFSRLDDAWRAEFGDEVERPHWAELLTAEGDRHRCVPPDPGIEATALGAGQSSLPCTAPAEALHTFTLDSGASRCFFRDSTTLTPLPAPVLVRLEDPSGSPVVARSSTVLPCLAVPSGSLSGHHLPSFSMLLVSTADLQDSMVTTTTLGGQRVLICTCTRMGHHLAPFTRRPGSSLYTLATEPPQVAASAQVSVLGQVAAPCLCRLLSHQTLPWHHRLGHPSLPRLRGMHSRLLLFGLPRSLPPLPPSPAPPCLPCVEGRQRAAPHSSSFPPTTAPLQTLHRDMRGSACFSRQGRERYFRLVVDDYIRGGEFSSDLLWDFCRGEGILQSFTLPDSPQQNGIGERRIGLVMEVARTSMIHAAAPHFLWPFAVWYAAHQLNLWPRVSLPEASPTLHWTGEVSDASLFRVWGSHAFVYDTSADKLSGRVIPCDVTFDESDSFYRLFPYRSAPPPPPPLFLAPGPPPVDPLPPQGSAPLDMSQVLQRFGFQFSSPQPTPLSTGHSLSAPPSDESVEPSGLYQELVGCLITSGMGLVLGGRGPVVLTGHADSSWVDDSATQRSSQGYTFSLGSGSVSWRSTRSSSVLSSSCEAEIYAGTMAAQELRWLTYLQIDLGEKPRSQPVLYVDNKAMIALCDEHRLEHRTKHIALRYFLARELQQRGQLCLAYVATRANIADIFTKALPPGDHQRFSSVLGLVPTLPHLLIS